MPRMAPGAAAATSDPSPDAAILVHAHMGCVLYGNRATFVGTFASFVHLLVPILCAERDDRVMRNHEFAGSQHRRLAIRGAGDRTHRKRASGGNWSARIHGFKWHRNRLARPNMTRDDRQAGVWHRAARTAHNVGATDDAALLHEHHGCTSDTAYGRHGRIRLRLLSLLYRHLVLEIRLICSDRAVVRTGAGVQVTIRTL